MPFCVPSDKNIEKDVRKAISDLESNQKQQTYDLKRAVKTTDFKRTEKRNIFKGKDKDRVIPISPSASENPIVLAPQISEDSSRDTSVNTTSAVEPMHNDSFTAAAEDAAVSPHLPISTASPLAERHAVHSESEPLSHQNAEQENTEGHTRVHRSSSLLGHLPAIHEGRKVAHPLIHSEPARSSLFHPAASNRFDDDDTDAPFSKGGKKKGKKKKANSVMDLKSNTDMETQLMSRVLEEIDIDDDPIRPKQKEPKKAAPEQHTPSPLTQSQRTTKTQQESPKDLDVLDSFHNNMVRSMDRTKHHKTLEEVKGGGSELQLMSELLQELGEDITIDAAPPLTARQSVDNVPPTARGSHEGIWGSTKRGSIELPKPAEKPRMKQLDIARTKDNSLSDLLAEFE